MHCSLIPCSAMQRNGMWCNGVQSNATLVFDASVHVAVLSASPTLRVYGVALMRGSVRKAAFSVWLC